MTERQQTLDRPASAGAAGSVWQSMSGALKLPDLGSYLQRSNGGPIRYALEHRWFRKPLLGVLGRRLERFLMEEEGIPWTVRKERRVLGRAIMRSVTRFFDEVDSRETMRTAMRERVLPALLQASLKQGQAQARFKERFHDDPPGFLTISPTGACNLRCKGCYANSSETIKAHLDYEVFERLLVEKRDLWGSWFTVISGGEPMMYRSGGKTLLDVVEAHPESYFLMFTNGTLITEEVARRMAELGNITPAISVEGYEAETDERRGEGVYGKILGAYERLRRWGVPFGVSMTVFRENAHMVSQELFDRYMEEHGAKYMWLFQYMPIGREQTLQRQVTPEQRLAMYNTTWKAVRESRMFIADFWNSGSFSSGCVSAGRAGGYLYVDWHGNVTPCVFNPYSPVNINEAYREGKDLNDVLMDPFFKEIRGWQDSYGLRTPAEQTGNFMVPCPIRDHYDFMLPALKKHRPRAIDPSGEAALEDESYQQGLTQYGREVAALTDPIWEKEVIEPERRRQGSARKPVRCQGSA
jgi:MoaA/NifB/PqqE/SkfB family radical SAM enzyme